MEQQLVEKLLQPSYSRHHHTLILHQMDAQLLGHEEGRENFRWDVENRKGGGIFDGFGTIT